MKFPVFARHLIAACTLALTATPAIADTELRVGIALADIRAGAIDVDALVSRFEERMRTYAGLRVTVKPVFYPADRPALDQLLDGSIDVARIDPAAYLRHKPAWPKLRLLALQRDTADGATDPVIFARAEDAAADLGDLAGKSVAFGAENSAAGHFLPQFRLAKSGVKAFQLSRYVYVPQSRKIALGVAAGVFDFGVIDRSTFRQMVGEGRPLRSLVELPCVDHPWVAGPRVPDELAAVMRRALPGLSFERFALIEGSERDLADVDRAIAANPRFFNHRPI